VESGELTNKYPSRFKDSRAIHESNNKIANIRPFEEQEGWRSPTKRASAAKIN